MPGLSERTHRQNCICATYQSERTAEYSSPAALSSRREFAKIARDNDPDGNRRGFLRSASALGAGILGSGLSIGAPTSLESGQSPDSDSSRGEPATDSDLNTADILIETLIAWQVEFVFGIVGDGINSIIEALRKRRTKIRFIAVRHEEAAAFMASGYAKHTGKLGVCLATTGPGAVHLLNGLYDAKMDSAPVLAITGTTFHDLGGTHFMQSVDTQALMRDVAIYNIAVTGPIHAGIVGNLACRSALGQRGVAHLTIAKDTQAMRLAADKPSMENHGLRTLKSLEFSHPVPDPARLQQAAAVINSGSKVAILVGQGALGAREEVIQLAAKLNAPVAKALLGKAVLADESPYTTGGIGHLGTAPSEFIMNSCDTLLILGSTMPWVNSYPKPGQARAIQIDLKAEHIGIRYPVEVPLVSDVKATVAALLPLLNAKDAAFLRDAQSHMRDWRSLLDRVCAVARSPLRPQMVMRELSNQLAPDAVISLDCGANTHFAARIIELKEQQKLTGTGMLATMAPGLPFAIAAQLAFPSRQSVAVVGDGGFTQLMGELVTAVKYELPIKIIILKNNNLAEVLFEQQELGNPTYGCELAPIDFAAFAKGCGADGFRCSHPAEVKAAIQSTLRSARTAVLEVLVDANEKPALPSELRV
jgi:pyruvate dehydrogenase (quinone)